ncbi:NAD(P)-binding protein [Rhexocercosporidium sp. MPI-PUGE-AT-0058]|nr:NAD(P)-binding protein [Rhexocercosporidium sp. MPI-PUGE-AT-0058]
MSNFNLTGTAVIIGSASGMGRATALAFARAGVQGLALGDLNEPGVQETAKQAKQVATNPKFSITASHVDVRIWASVDAFFLAAVAKFRRIDYSVTTAGIYAQTGLIAGNDLEAYENIQNTNARGVLYHTKAALQVMLKQDPVVVQGTTRSRTLGRGAIVNVCSVAGILPPPGSVEYNASKFAAIGITKTAANEYGGSMIRINAVCPGPIDTPLLERAISVSPEFRNAATDSTSFKRFGDVDEVADTILFLVSPAGSYVTGTSMVVDGGYLNMA